MQAISIGTSALVTGILTFILSAPVQCADGGQLCTFKTHNVLGLQALSQDHAAELALLLGFVGGCVAALVIVVGEGLSRRQA